MTNIRDLLEQWVIWRSYRHGGIGKTMLQRCMDGMPGTNCPTCAGSGRAPGSMIRRRDRWASGESCPTCAGSGRVKLHTNHHTIHTKPCVVCKNGEVDGRTCLRCRGSGIVTEEKFKTNPAFINSTYCEPDNPTLQRIDRLVCELRRRRILLSYWFVVDAEYCDGRGGTQEIKAERLLINPSTYRSRLSRSLEWIDQCRGDRREAWQIPFPYQPHKSESRTTGG